MANAAPFSPLPRPLHSHLPLHLAVSDDLGKDLVSGGQACRPELAVMYVDEEEIVAGADGAGSNDLDHACQFGGEAKKDELRSEDDGGGIPFA